MQYCHHRQFIVSVTAIAVWDVIAELVEMCVLPAPLNTFDDANRVCAFMHLFSNNNTFLIHDSLSRYERNLAMGAVQCSSASSTGATTASISDVCVNYQWI
jgi:hypothetical protein